MANVFDVAKYVLELTGEITAMKLQKLVYYSEVWNLVWEEESLFDESIEAWANGAVVPSLYASHRGEFKVNSNKLKVGNSKNLTDKEKRNIEKVVDFYGKYTAQQLSDINHQEQPWIDAREGYPPMARCTNPIDRSKIFEYHSGIINDTKKAQ
jgi:uncharacterized phage-associated protein